MERPDSGCHFSLSMTRNAHKLMLHSKQTVASLKKMGHLIASRKLSRTAGVHRKCTGFLVETPAPNRA